MIKEWMIANPHLSVILLSVVVTVVMTLITKKFTNQNRMKELKEMQKACQIKIKNVKGDLKKQQEIQQQMMECSMEMMRHSFKPMLITFIPLIILFAWVRNIYTPILSSWFWWYFGGAILSSIIFRKVFDVA